MPEDIVFKPTNEFSEEIDTPKQTLSETITERLLKYGTLIVRDILATQAGAQMYEVPEGKTFFLVACSLNIENIIVTGSFSAKFAVDQQQFSFSASTSLLQISATATGDPEVNHSISSSFPIPLKFVAGFKFFGFDNPSTQGNTQVMMQGYEISNEFLK